MKHEANFNTYFNHWLKNVYKKTGAFELKQTKTQSIAFNSVVSHQVQALKNAKNGILVYKIPDVGYQNPFDCFSLAGVDAFVVIKYPNFFCLIDINDWIQEEKISERKSLLSIRAKEIATLVVTI